MLCRFPIVLASITVSGLSAIYLGSMAEMAMATAPTFQPESSTSSVNYSSTHDEAVEAATTTSALTPAQARSQGRGTGRRGVRR